MKIFIYYLLSFLLMSGAAAQDNLKSSDEVAEEARQRAVAEEARQRAVAEEVRQRRERMDALLAEARANPKWSDAAVEKVRQLRESIQAELLTLDENHWAGQYYLGDGKENHFSLDIAPKTGFVFEVYGGFGVQNRNYGKVEMNNGELKLSFTFRNEPDDHNYLSPTMIPVNWGERKYLIYTDKIVKFCNDINAGFEPYKYPNGSYLLKKGDHKKETKGYPEIPEEYRAYLLNKPIEAKIKHVGGISKKENDAGFSINETEITLNVGSKQGVLQGMSFYKVNPTYELSEAIVKSVSESSCTAGITQYYEDEPKPKAGWKYSTHFSSVVGSE